MLIPLRNLSTALPVWTLTTTPYIGSTSSSSVWRTWSLTSGEIKACQDPRSWSCWKNSWSFIANKSDPVSPSSSRSRCHSIPTLKWMEFYPAGKITNSKKSSGSFFKRAAFPRFPERKSSSPQCSLASSFFASLRSAIATKSFSKWGTIFGKISLPSRWSSYSTESFSTTASIWTSHPTKYWPPLLTVVRLTENQTFRANFLSYLVKDLSFVENKVIVKVIQFNFFFPRLLTVWFVYGGTLL